MEHTTAPTHGEQYDYANGEFSADRETNESLTAIEPEPKPEHSTERPSTHEKVRDEITAMMDIVSQSDSLDDGFLNLTHHLRHRVNLLAGSYAPDSEEQQLAVGLRDRIAERAAEVQTAREKATDHTRARLIDGVRTQTPLDTLDFTNIDEKKRFVGMLELVQTAMIHGNLAVDEQRQHLIKTLVRMQDYFPSMPHDFRDFVDSALDMLREEDNLTNQRSRDVQRNFADHRILASTIVMSKSNDPAGETPYTPNLVHYGRDISDSKIEIEKGQELSGDIREALEKFAYKIDSLGMGPKTTARAKALVANIMTKNDGIQLFERGGARMLDYGKVDHKVRAGMHIEADLDTHEIYAQWLDQTLRDQGIKLSTEQVQRLGLEWIVWHECGHLIENAYGIEMPRVQRYGSEWETELQDAAFDAGLAQKYKDTLENSDNFRIQSERFAEGLARKLVLDTLIADYGLTTDQSHAVGEGYLKHRRHERYDAAVRIANEERDKALINTKLEDYGTTFAQIGYGNPAGAEELAQILALTP